MAAVEIYTRAFCGYSTRAIDLLTRKDVDFVEYDVTMDAAKRAEMVERASGRNTLPQVFIDGVHIGGCDDLYALEEDGKLDALLKAA